jgi:hypothetical protein
MLAPKATNTRLVCREKSHSQHVCCVTRGKFEKPARFQGKRDIADSGLMESPSKNKMRLGITEIAKLMIVAPSHLEQAIAKSAGGTPT